MAHRSDYIVREVDRVDDEDEDEEERSSRSYRRYMQIQARSDPGYCVRTLLHPDRVSTAVGHSRIFQYTTNNLMKQSRMDSLEAWVDFRALHMLNIQPAPAASGGPLEPGIHFLDFFFQRYTSVGMGHRWKYSTEGMQRMLQTFQPLPKTARKEYFDRLSLGSIMESVPQWNRRHGNSFSMAAQFSTYVDHPERLLVRAALPTESEPGVNWRLKLKGQHVPRQWIHGHWLASYITRAIGTSITSFTIEFTRGMKHFLNTSWAPLVRFEFV